MQVNGKEHKYILFQPWALQKPSHKSHTWVHKGTEYKICCFAEAGRNNKLKGFFLNSYQQKACEEQR